MASGTPASMSLEQSFASVCDVRAEDLDGMARSLAVGDSLTRNYIAALLTECRRLIARGEIERVLDALPTSFAEVRSALNELMKTVGARPDGEPPIGMLNDSRSSPTSGERTPAACSTCRFGCLTAMWTLTFLRRAAAAAVDESILGQ
jgi:hypothetical protein